MAQPQWVSWAISGPSVRSGAGAEQCSLCRGAPPVEFLIDQGEEFAGGVRSCEFLDLAEGFAQFQEVFSGYKGSLSDPLK